MLALVTIALGYLLAAGDLAAVDGFRLTMTLVGAAFGAFGASALNQWVEVRTDARMARTRARPLPAGVLPTWYALTLGVALAVGGIVILLVWVNWLSAALVAFVAVSYVAVYTPLKRRTPLCTLIGAVGGAVPPMLGWAAATGRLDLAAWVLWAILFVWQTPHFMALAWKYREDYRRGGHRMMPAVDSTGRATGLIAVVYAVAIVPVSLSATLAGLAGLGYAMAATLFGAAFIVFAERFRRARTEPTARALFVASLVYLPVLLLAMFADQLLGLPRL